MEHTDCHGVLVVFGCREHLGFLGRDCCVPINQASEDATQSFDAKRQRCHVEQNNVFDVALQNAGLNGRTHGNNLVRVHALMWFLAKEFGHFFLDAGHPCHTADKHNLVDVTRGQACVFQRSLAGLHRGLDQVGNKAFQFGTCQFHHHVQRLAVGAHGDKRLVDFGGGRRREFDFRFFGGFFQTLQCHLVFGQVDLVLFFELVGKVVDDAHVKVFTAKECVAVGGFHLEQPVVDFQNGHVECAAAQVIDRDGFGFFFIKAIGKCGGCWLVDDAQHFEARDFAGVFGGLTLGVVEVGRHGDDRLGHLFAEIRFGGFFHFAQDERGDLRRRIFFTFCFDPSVAVTAVDDFERHVLLFFREILVVEPATDQALDCEDSVFGVCDRLPFGRLAHETFIVRECHDRRRCARAFTVFDHAGLCAVHDRDTRVGGSEVDTNNFSHVSNPLR